MSNERDADVLFKVPDICCACAALGCARHLESFFDSCFLFFFFLFFLHLNEGKKNYHIYYVVYFNPGINRRTVETFKSFYVPASAHPSPCEGRFMAWGGS